MLPKRAAPRSRGGSPRGSSGAPRWWALPLQALLPGCLGAYLRPLDVLLHAVDGLFGDGRGGLLDLPLAREREYAGDRGINDADDQRGQPAGDRLAESQNQAGGERAECVDAEDARAAEHAGADAHALALDGQLGLGQLHLLADQRRRLVGKRAHQLGDRAVVEVARVRAVLDVARRIAYGRRRSRLGTAHGVAHVELLSRVAVAIAPPATASSASARRRLRRRRRAGPSRAISKTSRPARTVSRTRWRMIGSLGAWRFLRFVRRRASRELRRARWSSSRTVRSSSSSAVRCASVAAVSMAAMVLSDYPGRRTVHRSAVSGRTGQN